VLSLAKHIIMRSRRRQSAQVFSREEVCAD
jgi:hypothetical protein